MVADLSIRYRRPALYDDELEVRVCINSLTPARIEHAYEVHRDGQLLATATTTLVCVDRDGKPQRIPEGLIDVGQASGGEGAGIRD